MVEAHRELARKAQPQIGRTEAVLVVLLRGAVVEANVA